MVARAIAPYYISSLAISQVISCGSAYLLFLCIRQPPPGFHNKNKSVASNLLPHSGNLTQQKKQTVSDRELRRVIDLYYIIMYVMSRSAKSVQANLSLCAPSQEKLMHNQYPCSLYSD